MLYLKESDVLLFQGDSITHGGRVESDWDFNHIIGHGYQDYIAQELGLYNIERAPKIYNRGVIGDTLRNIEARKQEDIFDLNPTIFSLLIGANDSNRFVKNGEGYSPTEFGARMRDLLNQIKELRPNIKFILCQPFRYVDESKEEELQKAYVADVKERAAIVEEIARETQAIFVPFQRALDYYILEKKLPTKKIVWDGVHPTYVGHGILAKCWLETVKNNWRNE